MLGMTVCPKLLLNVKHSWGRDVSEHNGYYGNKMYIIRSFNNLFKWYATSTMSQCLSEPASETCPRYYYYYYYYLNRSGPPTWRLSAAVTNFRIIFQRRIVRKFHGQIRIVSPCKSNNYRGRIDSSDVRWCAHIAACVEFSSWLTVGRYNRT